MRAIVAVVSLTLAVANELYEAGEMAKVPYDFHDVARLRAHLLTGLDSEVPPPQPERVPTQVKMRFQIFKIVNVDARIGYMKFTAWFVTSWRDPRLAWNVSEFGGVTDFRVHPSIGDEGMRLDDNMWLPQLHLYNAAEPMSKTLEVGAAWVYPDGSVFMSQPSSTVASPAW